MFTAKRSVKPLLLAGIAAAAYYAYTRMNEEQKRNLVNTIKQQGKDLLGKFRSGNSGPMQQNDANV
jgi:hypothetical protein